MILKGISSSFFEKEAMIFVVTSLRFCLHLNFSIDNELLIDFWV